MGFLSASSATSLDAVAASLTATLGPQLADPVFMAALRALASGEPVTAEALRVVTGLPAPTIAGGGAEPRDG